MKDNTIRFLKNESECFVDRIENTNINNDDYVQFWVGTQSEYDSLGDNVNDKTLYIICDKEYPTPPDDVEDPTPEIILEINPREIIFNADGSPIDGNTIIIKSSSSWRIEY